jgi:2-keto-4-pentenoate hydratase/2-oxohepta-3-ene-1,7-dioic acid hydratase in catechol pathway
MGSVEPGVPVFFMKPDTALLRNNQPFFYPDFSVDLQYETELVLRINRVGRSIASKFASRYYSEIGLGVDFTARDLQSRQRKDGLPWEVAKAFDYSAPLSAKFIPTSELGNLHNIDFHLDINGTTVQTGNSADMIFKFDEIIEYVSRFISLKIGDLIFTGTPGGVGAVHINDRLQGYIGSQLMFDFEVK